MCAKTHLIKHLWHKPATRKTHYFGRTTALHSFDAVLTPPTKVSGLSPCHLITQMRLQYFLRLPPPVFVQEIPRPFVASTPRLSWVAYLHRSLFLWTFRLVIPPRWQDSLPILVAPSPLPQSRVGPYPIRYSDAVTVSCVAYQQRYLRLSSLLVDRSASAYLQGAQSRQRTREPNGLTICTKTNKNITPLPACEQCRVCNKYDYTAFLTI